MRWGSFFWDQDGFVSLLLYVLIKVTDLWCIFSFSCEQHDHRVPPAERLKHLYRLLEEHYDLTGGDYHGESTLHVWATSSSSRSMRLEEYPIACMSYLTSIGADLDFLEDLDDMSQDPMNDLIDEAFRHPISISPILKDRNIPTSTWAIDWSRPLPATTHAYWEMMHVS